MEKGERILLILIILLILGAAAYFTFSKFKQEIGLLPFPFPSPQAELNFLITKTPAPAQPQTPGAQNVNGGQNPQPLLKNKRLANFPGILSAESLKNKKAQIKTKKGNIEFDIYPEATKAASNFLILASNGFYDGLTFHRVEKGFVIQGGDPNGDGSGGPGYIFEDEPVSRDYFKGTVAYANAGPNTNGSQFFIMLEDHPELPKKYTIFGKVTNGMEVLERVEIGDVMEKVVILNVQ